MCFISRIKHYADVNGNPCSFLQFVPVSAQLLVDLFQSTLHPVLAALDVVHLSHQGVLHTIVHHVNTLTSLPEILHFVFRKKGAFSAYDRQISGVCEK